MNLNKIYIGNTKDDGKEHLLYKKVSYYGNGIYFTDYLDLESEVLYNDYQIDQNSLKLFAESLNVECSLIARMSRRKVKKMYKTDREKMINVRRVFYGELVTRFKLNENSRYIMEKVEVKEILLTRSDEVDEAYVDMQHSKLYPMKESIISGMGVDNLRPIEYEQFDVLMHPKRKLLEMDYRKEL